MPSQRKIDACRANGAKGAGRKSAESRHKCALNALKHGLCSTASECMVLPNEDAALHEQLTESYMRRYRPQDECERQILLQIVYDVWRMRRVPAIETTLFHTEILNINQQKPNEIGLDNLCEPVKIGLAFKNMAINDRSFENLGRYESRIKRSFSRLMQDLNRLQANRPDSGEPSQPPLPPPPSPIKSPPNSEFNECKNEANALPSPSAAPRARSLIFAAIALFCLALLPSAQSLPELSKLLTGSVNILNRPKNANLLTKIAPVSYSNGLPTVDPRLLRVQPRYTHVHGG